jgi:hypothetical protein
VKKSNKMTAAVAAAAVASAIVAPMAAYASTDLTDISNSYAKDAILDLVAKGILTGKGNGMFDPSGKITRQEFAVVIAKAAGLDANDVSSTTFSDVAPWAANYVEAAYNAGLVNGMGGDVFGATQNLTREQMASIFVRALGIDATGKAANLTFADKDSISSWAQDAVAAAVEAGLINGTGNNTFDPKGTADRQQVALVASKFLAAKDENVNSKAKLTEAKATDDTTLTLTFDKEVKALTVDDIAVAVKASNQVVAVSDVTLGADKKSATVKVDKLAVGTSYTVMYAGDSVEFKTADAQAVDTVTVTDSKTLTVKFTQAVDTAKATFTTTRDGNPVVLTATFSDDKMSAKLASTTSLVAGNYTVKVGGIDLASGKESGTVAVQAEKVAKIEFLSDKLIKIDANSATVGYKVYNQYNEDITKKPLASGLKYSSSVTGALSDTIVAKGTLQLDAATDFSANQTIVITAIDSASGVTASKTFTVSDVAAVSDFNFGDVKIANSATRIVTNTAAVATIAVTAKDQYGTEFTQLDQAKNGISFIASDSRVGTELKKDATTGALYLEVSTAGMNDAETVTIIAVIKATGQTKTITIQVVKPATAAEVVATAPADIIAAGDAAGSVVIPLTVKDQFGADVALADIATQAGGFTITSSNGNVIAQGNLQIATTGTNKGKLVNTAPINGAGLTTVIVTVNATGKSTTFNLETKAARTINTLSLPSTLATNFIEGSAGSFAVSYKDQYGKDFTPANVAGYDVIVSLTKVSGDDGALSLNADLDADGIVTESSEAAAGTAGAFGLTAGAGKKGVYTLTVKYVNTATTEVVSQDVKTLNVVANSSAGITYSVADIAPLYKSGERFGDATALDQADIDAGYAKAISISAKDAAGNSYVIPSSSILSVTVDGTDATVTNVGGKWYIVGNNGALTADATTNLHVVVNTNEGVQTITKTVTISKSALTVDQVKLLDSTIDDEDAAAVTALTVANKAALTAGVDVYAYLIDQFGGHSLSLGGTAAQYATGVTLGGGDSVAIVGNKLVLTDADNSVSFAAGAKFRYVIITNNGKTAAIDITVTN